MAAGGRRTKLTDKRIKTICNYVRDGLTYEVAARLAGVHPSTFYRWKARAETAKKGIYRKFREELQKADAEAEATLLQEVRKEKGGPKWIMERRWPERWGQKIEVRNEGIAFVMDWGFALEDDEDGDGTETCGQGENAPETPTAD